VVEELTLGDLGGGLLNGLTDLRVCFLLILWFNPKRAEPTLTKTVLHVDGSGGTLKDTESLDNWSGHAVLGLVDVEVTQGAVPKTVSASCTCIPSRSEWYGLVVLPLGLGTPVLVSGNLESRPDLASEHSAVY
jgi:hypothetical protein